MLAAQGGVHYPGGDACMGPLHLPPQNQNPIPNANPNHTQQYLQGPPVAPPTPPMMHATTTTAAAAASVLSPVPPHLELSRKLVHNRSRRPENAGADATDAAAAAGGLMPYSQLATVYLGDGNDTEPNGLPANIPGAHPPGAYPHPQPPTAHSAVDRSTTFHPKHGGGGSGSQLDTRGGAAAAMHHYGQTMNGVGGRGGGGAGAAGGLYGHGHGHHHHGGEGGGDSQGVHYGQTVRGVGAPKQQGSSAAGSAGSGSGSGTVGHPIPRGPPLRTPSGGGLPRPGTGTSATYAQAKHAQLTLKDLETARRLMIAEIESKGWGGGLAPF